MNSMDHYKQSRRTFICAGGGLASATLLVNFLDQSPAEAQTAEANSARVQTLQPGSNWSAAPGQARHRYDGLAKVTGKKVYGRDFHASDMQGWPQEEDRVVILRVNAANKIFKGVDAKRLMSDLKVYKIITHKDFASDHLKIPFYFGRLMMAREGQRPDYLGQPAALLFIKKKDFLELGPKLFDLSPYLQFGSEVPLGEPTSYGMTRLTRYSESETQNKFSVFQDGMSSPPWEKPDVNGSTNARCVYYGQLISEEIQSKGWTMVEGKFSTQSIDPVFMESESGLAWFDKKNKLLHMTLGTQSPYEDGDACLTIFSDPLCPHKIKSLQLNCCYPGGGFGGRDHSDFPLYLAIAAIYANGKPIRIVYNRFEQFQAGIKRHPARISEKIAVDNEGIIQALSCDIALDGGGQNNFSFAVQAVAAQNATAAYYIPRLDIQSQALSSIGVTSGSMRGFGTLQAMFALESLVDEAALKLKMDPIDMRLKNLLTKSKSTSMGGRPTFEIQSEKVLRAAQASRLWRDREALKKSKSNNKVLYGLGFALAVKSYGTNLDACLAAVEISAEGQLSIKSNGIDMGNGLATTLSLVMADILGRNANTFKGGVTQEFEALKLTGSFESSQDAEDQKARNPRWVPYLSMSQAASAGAYQMRHAVREAASILLRNGVWPAACELLRLDQRNFDRKRLDWQDGQLIVDGQSKLAWNDLVQKIYEEKLITGAMVHTYYRSQWAKATFKLGRESETLPIDALALRSGRQDRYTLFDRERIEFPPFKNNRLGVDMFTPYGLIVAVSVNKETGEVKLDEAEGFIDVGQMIQREIVEGQALGALAMGMGQALFEDLPITAGGPGEGMWNIGRYRLPTMRDMPLNRFKLQIVEPVPGDPPKGMAEVVECAVVPAFANAIAHATGKRFRDLPINPERVKGALA